MYAKIVYIPSLHDRPVHPLTQVQLSGAEQVPPFWQASVQKTVNQWKNRSNVVIQYVLGRLSRPDICNWKSVIGYRCNCDVIPAQNTQNSHNHQQAEQPSPRIGVRMPQAYLDDLRWLIVWAFLSQREDKRYF